MEGKRTYALVILALISAAALYAQDFVTNGFNVEHLMAFIGGSAVTAAIAALRSAVSKITPPVK